MTFRELTGYVLHSCLFQSYSVILLNALYHSQRQSDNVALPLLLDMDGEDSLQNFPHVKYPCVFEALVFLNIIFKFGKT